MEQLRKWQPAVIGLASLMAATTAWAQDGNISAIEKKLEELDQEVRILKRQLELEREAQATKSNDTPVVTASSKDGFSIQSPDKTFQLKVRGYVHADGRYFADDEAGASTFTARRVRPIFDGTVAKNYEFRIMPDFGGGTTQLVDAYVDVNYWPEAKVRVGKFKSPLSLERLQSITDDPFIEVGMPASSFLPNRDTGVQLFGDVLGGTASYAVGYFNGATGGANLDNDVEDDKDLAGRIFVQPFKQMDVEPLRGLGLGAAASIGHNEGALPTFKTPGQQTFFSYRSDVTADGKRVRIVPQGSYYYGPLGILGEYAMNSEQFKRAGTESDLDSSAWLLAATYFLTGEENSYKTVKILHPLDAAQNSWGAVELKGRFSGVRVDKDAFIDLATLTSSAQRADELGVGVNWHLNKNVKLMLDYEHTGFNGGDVKGDRKDESVILSRLQLVY